MKSDLQQRLFMKYPKIFQHVKQLTVGDGWYTIIDQLCKHIQEYLDWSNATGPWRSPTRTSKAVPVRQVVATQVKEKFGGLRFYYGGGDDKTDGMITIIEAMSIYTCEQCGNAGRPTGACWIKTLCNSCSGDIR